MGRVHSYLGKTLLLWTESPRFGANNHFLGRAPTSGAKCPILGKAKRPVLGRVPASGQSACFWAEITHFWAKRHFSGGECPLLGKKPSLGRRLAVFGQSATFWVGKVCSLGREHPFLGSRMHPFVCGGVGVSFSGAKVSIFGKIASLFFWGGRGVPILGPECLFLGSDHPFLGPGCPFLGSNRPFLGPGCPFLGLERPFSGLEHQFWAWITPFWAQITPFWG